MSRQFDIHRNDRAPDSAGPPFLINLQSDFLDGYHAVMAAPIWWSGKLGRPPQLAVPLEIENGRYFVSVMEMALIPKRVLGPVVSNAGASRDRIIRALDYLFTGI